ncbi:C40 family peptidase [Actinomadura scrupuli]|uniref:C40 family peptidase n=1 Tax=Actinomadura scrupuli TaxID=559629 RepID=UPI003D97A155
MALLLGTVGMVVLLVAVVFGGVIGALVTGSGSGWSCAAGPAPAAHAASDIPADYLAWYQQAGALYGVPWPVLAAIGKTESDHGRGKGSGIHSGANDAGAMGPMQFLSTTWKAYGVDGNGDGSKDVHDPTDAIFGAAHLLKADGAPEHLDAAIFQYNHAAWYVKTIRALATGYAGGIPPEAVTAAGCAAGALPPNVVAAKVIAYARAQLGKPYVWGAQGPDAFDCSGLTMMAYQAVGVRLPHYAASQWNSLSHVPPGQQQPGDLVFFEMKSDGPGHVGIFIGNGEMIEAPNHTAPVRVSTVNRPDRVGYARPSVGFSSPEDSSSTN